MPPHQPNNKISLRVLQKNSHINTINYHTIHHQAISQNSNSRRSTIFFHPISFLFWIILILFKMRRNKNCAKRAWNVLRLAMLWTRKGGVFKRRLAMELRLVPKYIKSLGHAAPRDQIHYGERQLSFDDTPMFHVKMHRPASMRFLFPCISAEEVDFDYDFGEDLGGDYGYDSGRKSFLKGKDEDEEEEVEGEGGELCEYEVCEEEAVPVGEEEIDSRAEEFIAKFYAQVKLQRQISYLQYTEMLNRGASC